MIIVLSNELVLNLFAVFIEKAESLFEAEVNLFLLNDDLLFKLCLFVVLQLSNNRFVFLQLVVALYYLLQSLPLDALFFSIFCSLQQLLFFKHHLHQFTPIITFTSNTLYKAC